MLKYLQQRGVQKPGYLLGFGVALSVLLGYLLWRGLRAPTCEELLDQAAPGQPLVERMKAMYLLGERGPKAGCAVERLLVIMGSDGGEYIQDAATITLGHIGDLRALPPIEERSKKYEKETGLRPDDKDSPRPHHDACQWAIEKLRDGTTK